jgi:cytoskeleton protein RodZ
MQAALESPPREVFAGLSQSLAQGNRKFLLTALALVTSILLIIWLPSWPTPATAPPAVLTAPAQTESAVTTVMPSELSVSPVVAPPSPAVIAPDPAVSAANGKEVSLVFKGKSDSWVEVKTSTGVVVFSQLVRAGETHQVKAEPLLNVVIGMADGVDVQLRGQPFDLTPFSRGAVARFEVK